MWYHMAFSYVGPWGEGEKGMVAVRHELRPANKLTCDLALPSDSMESSRIQRIYLNGQRVAVRTSERPYLGEGCRFRVVRGRRSPSERDGLACQSC